MAGGIGRNLLMSLKIRYGITFELYYRSFSLEIRYIAITPGIKKTKVPRVIVFGVEIYLIYRFFMDAIPLSL